MTLLRPLLCTLLLTAIANAQDASVHINQLQFIGTHNSYHAGFAPSEAVLMQRMNPQASESLDYRHPAARPATRRRHPPD